MPATGLVATPPNALENFRRTTEFWARAATIYAAYKVVQVKGQITASCAFLQPDEH